MEECTHHLSMPQKFLEVLRPNKKELAALAFGTAGLVLDGLVTYLSIGNNPSLEGNSAERATMMSIGVIPTMVRGGAYETAIRIGTFASGKLIEYGSSELPNKALWAALGKLPFYGISTLYYGAGHFAASYAWLVGFPPAIDDILRRIFFVT